MFSKRSQGIKSDKKSMRQRRKSRRQDSLCCRLTISEALEQRSTRTAGFIPPDHLVSRLLISGAVPNSGFS
jgi:hypothetical protein